ncbi:hypothetical protein JCM8097_004387 [Rhodosporidiobolus ruineniae]
MAQGGHQQPGVSALGGSAGVKAAAAAGWTANGRGQEDRVRPLPPPIVTDFAFEDGGKAKKDEAGAPLSPRTSNASRPKEHPSPHKQQHKRYKHHEPAPRRLLKRLGSLFNPEHKHSHSLPSSALSSAPLSRTSSKTHSHSARPPSSPLVAEPESIASSAQPFSSGDPSSVESVRPSIKIRICTFNMHDSLPSSDGDLSEFLGDVGAFPSSFAKKPKKRMSSHSSFGGKSSSRGSVLTVPLNGDESKQLPKYPLTEGHPYHILVVCGQECPTASGVLAGKVRTLDGKGWTSILENYLCGGGSNGDSDSESSSSSSSEQGDDGTDGEPDAQFRSGDSPPPPTASSSAPNERPPPTPSLAGPSSAASHRSASGSRAGSSLGHHRPRGPYVLVEKERLLGIYIAVFVARCCEDLVEGVSKGRVTAGLIGGRVGNKGGVGVSLHFASSRLLFISAHLAAHASGLEIRKANALKILEEMDVDDFWDSAGKMGPKPKELSERFDQTFFMGDLNFRLNISRLHADWLVRGNDFVTALRFDQLRDVLAEANGVFRGFKEGEITFPPTYKLETRAMRAVRKKRSTILGRRTSKRANSKGDGAGSSKSPVFDFSITEAAEAASANESLTDPEVSHSTAKEDDSLSIISSVGSISTTAGSISGFDPAVERSGLDKTDLTSLGLPTPPSKGNETSMDAVRKAQVRFLTLVRSNSAAAAIAHAQAKAQKREAKDATTSPSTPTTPRLASLFPPRPILQASQSAVVLPSIVAAQDANGKGKSNASTDAEGEGEKKPIAETVFDLSSKQRVQSYTDRILFKSTIVPPPPSPPESDDEEPLLTAAAAKEDRQVGFDLRSRRSTNFAAALRNLAHHSSSSEDEDDRGARGRPLSADGSRRRRPFSRPRLFGASSDSLADPEPTSTTSSRPSLGFPRTKSAGPTLVRRGSNADSVGTDGSAETHPAPSFWKRVRSLKDLASLPQRDGSPSRPSSAGGSAPPSTVTSPVQSPINSPAGNTPTTPTFPSLPPSAGSSPPFQRRTPRKKFTLSSPPSSPDDSRAPSPLPSSRPPFSRPASDTPPMTSAAPSSTPSAAPSTVDIPSSRPSTSRSTSAHVSFPTRAATMTANGLDGRHSNHQHSASSASLNTRFKSFLNLLPLPFLSSNASRASALNLAGLAANVHGRKKRRVKKVGPRKGEVQVIKYDCVTDLAKMGAT